MPRGKRFFVRGLRGTGRDFIYRYRLETSEYREASKAPLVRPRVKNVITIIIVVLVIIYNEAAVNFISIRSPAWSLLSHKCFA